MTVSMFDEPPLGTALVGLVDFLERLRVPNTTVEFKMGSQVGNLGTTLRAKRRLASLVIFMGFHSGKRRLSRISLRMVNASGVASEVVKRTYEVSNLPAAQFRFHRHCWCLRR